MELKSLVLRKLNCNIGPPRSKLLVVKFLTEAEPETGIISEIKRYMANPKQALSYKIGQLKIRELRNKAEKI